MRLAFIILAHREPENIARLAKLLVEGGGYVAIHYDLKAPTEEFTALCAATKTLSNTIIIDRIEIGWGQWSIVQATLNSIEALEGSGEKFDYVHLMSGMDYLIKPVEWYRTFLRRYAGSEFIETVNICRQSWVQSGLEHERYQYKHIHNWQKEQRSFDRNWQRQRDKNQKREFIEGVSPFLGSQWWTLTWETCIGALAWSQNAQIKRFFETVWIPDEMFFQTYVGNHISPNQINNITLTLYQFDYQGLPIVYYDDHVDYLIRQHFFFARKISSAAAGLRDGLDAHISNLRNLNVLVDDSPGQRTVEALEMIERHRWGLTNHRRIGHSKDPWYGDLEWNKDSYIVIAVISRSGAARVQQALRRNGLVICHGELFSSRSLEFVDGVKQFAGYRSSDIALRDHKPTNFLVDVIKAGAPLLTSFVFVLDGVKEILEIMIWDPQARFVLVEIGIIDAYLETQRLADDTAGLETTDVLDDLGSFSIFARSYLAEATNQFPTVKEKLGHADKQALIINSFDDNWEERLRLFSEEVFKSNGGAKIAKSPRINLQAHKPAASDGGDFQRVVRLLAALPDGAERDRSLERLVTPITQALGQSNYFVVTVFSERDARLAEALKIVLPGFGQVLVQPSSARVDIEHEGSLIKTYAVPNSSVPYVCSIETPKYRLDSVERSFSSSLLRMLFKDGRSIALTIGTETKNPLHLQHQVSLDIKKIGVCEGKQILEIDLSDPSWFVEIVDLISKVAGPITDDEADRFAQILSRHLGGDTAYGMPGNKADLSDRFTDIHLGLEPYVVFVTASCSAAELGKIALQNLEHVNCHSGIFEGTEAYTDPLGFVATLVGRDWPSLTVIIVIYDDGFPWDALMRDPRAHFVVLTVDPVAAFFEDKRYRELNVTEMSKADENSDLEEGFEFAIFARKLSNDTKRMQDALIHKTNEFRRSLLWLDSFDTGWSGQLIKYMRRLIADRPSGNGIVVDAGSHQLVSPVELDIGHISKLIRLIADSKERDRSFARYLSPVTSRELVYVIVVVFSYVDKCIVEALTAAIPDIEWVIVRHTALQKRPALSETKIFPIILGAKTDVGQENDGSFESSSTAASSEIFSVECRRYQAAGLNSLAGKMILDLLMSDPGSRTLVIHGNMLAVLTEFIDRDSGPSVPASPTFLQSNLAAIALKNGSLLHVLHETVATNNKKLSEIDLLTVDWFEELLSFLDGLTQSIAFKIKREEITQALRGAIMDTPDPIDRFDNPLELIKYIPISRRSVHEEAVRSSLKMRQPSEGTNGVVRFPSVSGR